MAKQKVLTEPEESAIEGDANQPSAASSLTALGVGDHDYSPQERAATDRAITQAAYFSLFSIPNPSSPTQPVPLIPFIPQLAIGFNVHEGLHRFEVFEPAPNPVCGFDVTKAISKDIVATVHMNMVPMPNNFQAALDRVPPPTLLLPFLYQRFSARNGSLQFNDTAGSGFRAFGCGRTFPGVGGSPASLIGILDLIEGFGSMVGVQGTGIVNGEIQPPSFAFNTLFRIVDLEGKFQSSTSIAPLPPNDPVPDMVFLPFLSEPDRNHPLSKELTPDGKHLLVHITEKLRLVSLSLDVSPAGIRSSTIPGTVVGRYSSTLILDVSNPGPVIPGYSRDGEFTFFDGAGGSLGGLKADLFEARFFPTYLPGLTAPIIRIGGMAPPTAGTGQFQDPAGMVSVNGAFSLVTGSSSTMYMVRLWDPLGRLQPVVS